MSSELGRFLQRDPLGYVDGLNLYEYVGAHVVNAVDPMGLKRQIRSKNIIKRWPPLGQNKFRFSLSLKPSDAVVGGSGGSMIYVLDYSWTTRADVTYCDCDGKIQTESGTLKKSGTIQDINRNPHVPLFQTRKSDPMLLPTPAKTLKKLLFSVLGGIAGDVLVASIDIDANIFIIDGLMNDQDALDKLVKTAPRNINNMEWKDLQFIECD